MNKYVRLLNLLIGTVLFCFAACAKDDSIAQITLVNNVETCSTLENYLKPNADDVHLINGFSIAGSATNPSSNSGSITGATGKEVIEHFVRLFSNFVNQNNNGVIDTDKTLFNTQMVNKVLLISGPISMVNDISKSFLVKGAGIYGMSMQTDKWPYINDDNRTGWIINSLTSSTWRPETMNALWEETFHTVTEAISRSDSEFAFTQGAQLRQLMDADIAAGTYDISEQNAEEGGNYDRVTAVNEYIHQIWAINFAGQGGVLNTHQTNALNFMVSKNVPMQLNPNYTHVIGTRIKE